MLFMSIYTFDAANRETIIRRRTLGEERIPEGVQVRMEVVDLSNNHRQQKLAVKSGHWPLFRFDPKRVGEGRNPLHLDSAEPSVPYREFVQTETRFNMLWHTHPEDAERFLEQAQKEINHRYHYYKQLAELDWNEKTKVTAAKAKIKNTITES